MVEDGPSAGTAEVVKFANTVGNELSAWTAGVVKFANTVASDDVAENAAEVKSASTVEFNMPARIVVVLESADTVDNAMRVKNVVGARFVNMGAGGIIARTVVVLGYVSTVEFNTDARFAGKS